ncbi:MAG: hypothetical protein FWF06_01510 [Symbiobacteriaceae bacterium]|nr:hypothetical protein [Symbiobacteriaceae bacterium]
MLLCGILMVALPPLFVEELQGALPVLILAVMIIFFALWGLIRQRFASMRSSSTITTQPAAPPSGKEGTTSDPVVANDASPAWEPTFTSQGGSLFSGETAPTAGRGGTPPGSAAPSSEIAGQPSAGTRPSVPPATNLASSSSQGGLFDMDPQLIHHQIFIRLQAGLLELFDTNPDAVREAIAILLQREADNLFDADPDTLKASMAEMLQQKLLDLFDIDPMVVRQALAARSAQELAQLFDVDPDQVRQTIQQMLEEALFDTDPETVRQTLAALREDELLELFDIAPELIKAAFRLRYANEVLELIDKDPAVLRATFAWRQDDRLTEIYDTDPEALRALWEAQKAVPRGFDPAAERMVTSLPYTEAVEVWRQQQELLEGLSQISLGALERRRRFIQPESEEYSGEVTMYYLRHLVVLRMVEDKMVSLEIREVALRGIFQERQVNPAQKAALLLEVSQMLTAARSYAKQLQLEARQQLARQRLQEQDAVFRSSQRPRGEMNAATRERIQQRMLERSRQANTTKKES